MIVRLEIAYDGGDFTGWAAQPGLRTVQGELEQALSTVLRQPVSLTVAGRTDAGVHARGQVASFELAGGSRRTDPESPRAEIRRLAERVNGMLPRDLAVRSAAPAPEGFDARRDARSRTYCYRVLASRIRDPFEEGRALWWRHRIDRALLDECAAAVVGTHDFSAFTPTQTEHVRFEREVLRCEWTGAAGGGAVPASVPGGAGGPAGVPGGAGGPAGEPGGILELWIEADAFMRHMVRVLVGTMLEVAGGRRSHADFRALLEGAPRERAGETAPPQGLYLVAIRY